MTIDSILSAIDEEIAKLQKARAMLSGAPVDAGKKSVGRPKGSKSETPVKTVKKRTMSAEGKARIAAAQKKRWAAAKRTAKQV
jgi:hypothetical protein